MFRCFHRVPPQDGARACRAVRRVAAAIALAACATAPPVCAAADGFLGETEVRETLAGHTLRGKDWTEYYGADGRIEGRGRHLGIRDYSGRWTVDGSKVCYLYGHASFDTCSWLRRDGDRVTHHHRDGSPKKDGVAVRRPGNALGEFR